MTKRSVEKRPDLRVTKTKQAIKDATLALLQANPDTTPHATDIIARAQINKSTFYYHYESVQDLLAALEQELFDDVMVRALNGIDLLIDDPTRFLERFGSFVYQEPRNILMGNGSLKTSIFDALLSSLEGGVTSDAAADAPSTGATRTLAPCTVEVILLGLWGYTRRVTQAEYERAIPHLAQMLKQGLQ